MPPAPTGQPSTPRERHSERAHSGERVNRRSLLIGVGAGLAVLLIWYFLLWSPRGKAIDDAKGRQQAAADQADELEARLNQLRDAQRNEAATRAQIAQLQEAI